MRTKNMILAMTAVGALFATSPSWAVCRTFDLAGVYHIYANWVDAGVAGWTKCRIIVQPNGNVLSGTSCEDSDGFVETTTGGSFAVTSLCNVTGSITTTSDEGPHTIFIDDAWFNPSKTVMTGVGNDTDGGNFFFTAVKE